MNDAVDIAVTQTNAENTASVDTKTFTKTDKVMAAVCAVLSYGYICFSVMNTLGFFTTAVYIMLLTFSIVFMKKKGCKFTKLNFCMAAVLYVFTLVFSVTDSGLIKFLDSVFMFFGGAYFIYSTAEGCRNIERYLPFAMIKAVFEFPFSKFGTQISVTKQSVKNPNTATAVKNVIVGLILAVPLTFTVGVLLICADKGMESMFHQIFNSDFFEQGFKYLIYLVIGFPCSLYLYGMIYANCERKELNVLDHDKCWQFLERFRSIPNGIAYTSVTPICILYVMFFISQANYFLSAFRGTLPAGYTYAQYARRGFFELLAVTVINLGVIVLINLLSKKSGEDKAKGLKFYTTTLSVFTLVLIAVALSKMVMYISRYGLTRLRLYTSWFMVLCALIFILIIIKQFNFRFRLAGWCTGIFVLMFAVLCFGRPDWIVAKYNIEMYNAGYLDELDTDAILDMSDDAILAGLDAGVLKQIDAYFDSDISENKFMKKMNIPSLILSEKLKDYADKTDQFRIPEI